MSRIRFVAIVLGFVVISCLYGRADEQAARLPDDGWWIRYAYADKQEASGEVREYSEKQTYSLVGTVMEDGEKCRWIELKDHSTFRDEERIFVCSDSGPSRERIKKPFRQDILYLTNRQLPFTVLSV